ncbi:MAG: hypothetical protein Q8P67_21820, partial [archaeon]|nr:hypothetical protein [archaeon]
MPFLEVQRQYLINQLSENREEFSSTMQEIRAISEEQSYSYYVKALKEARLARRDPSSISSRPRQPLPHQPQPSSVASPARPTESTPPAGSPIATATAPVPPSRTAAPSSSPPQFSPSTAAPVSSIDDFAPEPREEDLKGFLGSSDDETPNPFVAKNDDPTKSGKKGKSKPKPKSKAPTKQPTRA